jgi:hypothetical protein
VTTDAPIGAGAARIDRLLCQRCLGRWADTHVYVADGRPLTITLEDARASNPL